jgi:hypothetical protein
MLHENGHLAGLDHSPDCNAVMFATLAGLQTKRALADDDIAAIATLYPLEFEPLPVRPPLPRAPAQHREP